jgi:hypothetical protein
VSGDPNEPVVMALEPGSRNGGAALFVLGALACIGGAIAVFVVSSPSPTSGDIGEIAALLIFGALAAFGAWSVWNSHAILRRDSLELHGAWRTRIIDRSDVIGIRDPQGRDNRSRLALKTGRPIPLEPYLIRHPAFRQWLGTPLDLDEDELQRNREALESDPALGANLDDRRATLRRMTWVARVGTAIAWLVTGWTLFWPRPYEWAVGIALALPLIALALHVWSDRIFSLDVDKNDARPSLNNLYALPALAVAMRSAVDLAFVDGLDLLGAVAVAAALFAAILAVLDRRIVARRATWFPLAMFALVYGYAAVTQADTLLDKATAVSYPVTVRGKHISGGKTTTYYLDVSSWGPGKTSGDISVTRSQYDTVGAGSHICMYVQPGWLHIAWYYAGGC